MLPAHTSDEPMIRSKYIVLFGSTGAGKTTTIAKLAAKTAIQQQKKIALSQQIRTGLQRLNN